MERQDFGLVGLGVMGENLILNIEGNGFSVSVFNRTYAKTEKFINGRAAGKNIKGFENIKDFVESIKTPRKIMLLVKAGDAVDSTIENLIPYLEKDDIIIDGGNSFYKDSMRRAEGLKKRGVSFLDVGTSGGIWGLKIGYCMMIGGDKNVFDKVEPVFKTLAPENGYAHVGPHSAGHFVKMIHNGIEYAMLQGYAEGFEIMNAKKEFNLDLHKIADLWNNGSVIRSWLLELAESAFQKDPNLDSIRGYVEDSGEGRWTVAEAIEEDVPAPVITLSLLERFRSRQEESFSAKVIAALRNEFGGHGVRKTK